MKLQNVLFLKENKKRIQFVENRKKELTKGKECGNINKLSHERPVAKTGGSLDQN